MPIKTTHLLLGYAVVAGAAAVVVVPAIAQDSAQISIRSSATATPSKAGTPAHPRGLSIRAEAELLFPEDIDPPVVTAIEIRTAPGIDWHGEHFVKCTKATLDHGGPRRCPKESIMGTAVATGHADTVAARLKVVFVNGGANTTFAYATLNRPARIRDTLVVHSTRFSSGPWGHMESVAVPHDLQIVAGIPLALNRIKLNIGGKRYAKDYISSTACPSGGWKYQVTAHTTSGDQTAANVGTGRISCTK
ncbi:MAG TPA: hypothetical protein VFG42_01430 [Baekduia sp.]|uniref:hypothetical protein n=1 Tax=Baekduia sp. TaxID=2600305 RepID=UPI002D78109B|nr:hypothetical protein [Baekduia sp.]HET6505424.1 hypothetical protein [Baekduia sp.]